MNDPVLNMTMTTLAQQLSVAVKALLISKGLKQSSDVVKSVQFVAKDNLIQFLANDYLETLSTGRRAGGKKVPIKYILEFIQQNTDRNFFSRKTNLEVLECVFHILRNNCFGCCSFLV